MKFKLARIPLLILSAALIATGGSAYSAGPDLSPKPATAATIAANKAFAQGRDFNSAQETEDATRGFIAALPDPVIKNAKGDVVFDAGSRLAFKGDAPDTVNPSLWQSAKLTAQSGLFKVMDGVYQIRGTDISNMTLVEGKTGWIVIDPLLAVENAKASMALVKEKLGDKPVVAMIYTHSHIDHFGGARGVIDEADVKAGKVRVIAPEGFMENAVAENVLAGNAMGRRAHYMYGLPLPVGEKGNVGVGLGPSVSTGVFGLIPPTELVTKTGQEMMVDGVRIVFQMAPGTEAPSEMLFYFPDLKLLCLSEDVSKNMHNIYTIRGAKVRDSLAWSKYINELLDLFPDAEVGFASHHWPIWGKEHLRKELANQRDMYRFLHDRALNLANNGQKMADLANAKFYPKALQDDFSTRGYYGSLSHNLRAVYNFYLGFYDANPATLNPYGTVESATRYVAELGGAKAVIKKGRKAFAAGDYRWAAEMLNYVVMADPKNQEARALQADTLEQLGYQVENATWRGAYLTGAQELRQGVKPLSLSTMGPDVARALTPENVFDLMAVQLNHEKVDGVNIGVQFNFNDGEKWAVELSNSVLNNTKGRVLTNPNVTLNLSRKGFMMMTVGKVPLPKLIEMGEVKPVGDLKALGVLISNISDPNKFFNIVTP